MGMSRPMWDTTESGALCIYSRNTESSSRTGLLPRPQCRVGTDPMFCDLDARPRVRVAAYRGSAANATSRQTKADSGPLTAGVVLPRVLALALARAKTAEPGLEAPTFSARSCKPP